jgi:hypothetical protein
MAAGWAIGSGIALILLALTSYIIAAVSHIHRQNAALRSALTPLNQAMFPSMPYAIYYNMVTGS